MLDDGSKVWLADVNDDHKADLVAQGPAGGGAAGWVVLGLSNGTGFAHWSWTSGQRMLDDSSNAWLADMNGDGRADLTAQRVQANTVGGIYTGLSNGQSFAAWTWTW